MSGEVVGEVGRRSDQAAMASLCNNSVAPVPCRTTVILMPQGPAITHDGCELSPPPDWSTVSCWTVAGR